MARPFASGTPHLHRGRVVPVRETDADKYHRFPGTFLRHLPRIPTMMTTMMILVLRAAVAIATAASFVITRPPNEDTADEARPTATTQKRNTSLCHWIRIRMTRTRMHQRGVTTA